jgi:hypothetical protein
VITIPKRTIKLGLGLFGIIFLSFVCYDVIFNSRWGIIMLFLGVCGFLIWGIIRSHSGGRRQGAAAVQTTTREVIPGVAAGAAAVARMWGCGG